MFKSATIFFFSVSIFFGIHVRLRKYVTKNYNFCKKINGLGANQTSMWLIHIRIKGEVGTVIHVKPSCQYFY